MPRNQKLTSEQINDLIHRCISEDQKAFTNTLKEMEKAVGGKYFVLAKEGYEIFSKCHDMFSNNQGDSIVQYNALRLAKYTMDTPETLQKIYKEAWDLYQKTIFHNDGRVRVAGVRLLDRYYMGFQFLYRPYRPNKKIYRKTIDEVTQFVIKAFFELQNLETRYTEKNKKNLRKKDLPDKNGGIPWSSDTKDKFLKSIRMGTEIFHEKGCFDELLKENGYYQKTPNPNADKLFSPIKLKYHERKDKPSFNGLECTLCKQKNVKIGCTINAYSDSPQYFCEKCTIIKFQEEEGYSSYKIAEARRRRMFDVSYLFNELFTDAYIKQFGHGGIDDLDASDFNKIIEACCSLYNHLYNKEEKIRLEETESQTEIENEFNSVLSKLDMKNLFDDES